MGKSKKKVMHSRKEEEQAKKVLLIIGVSANTGDEKIINTPSIYPPAEELLVLFLATSISYFPKNEYPISITSTSINADTPIINNTFLACSSSLRLCITFFLLFPIMCS